jgi:hypothetical protein
LEFIAINGLRTQDLRFLKQKNAKTKAIPDVRIKAKALQQLQVHEEIEKDISITCHGPL